MCEGNKKIHIQSGLLTSIHAILMRLEQLNCSLPPDISKNVFDLVINYFQAIKEVNSDGIYVI